MDDYYNEEDWPCCRRAALITYTARYNMFVPHCYEGNREGWTGMLQHCGLTDNILIITGDAE